MNRVLVYGDVDPNVIDGSSVWLMSISQVLSSIFDEVHVQLKAPIETEVLVKPLTTIDNVVIHEGQGFQRSNGRMTPGEARDVLENLASELAPRALIARGFQVCAALSSSEYLQDILWSYITDLPFPGEKGFEKRLQELTSVSIRSRRMFCQTPATRGFLENLIPSAAGKTVLLPPMIPDSAYIDSVKPAKDTRTPLKIIYSGKFASAWRTLEMLELPRLLMRYGVDSELLVVGDKFGGPSDPPGWADRMREALHEAAQDPTSGVHWAGGLSREESLQRLSEADLAIGWRSSALDSSMEISTKMLEAGATTTAPIINRTKDHEELFGKDYPFFVSGQDDVSRIAQVIASKLPYRFQAAETARDVANYFSMSASTARLHHAFSRAGTLSDSLTVQGYAPKKVNLAIASHDLKFLGEIVDSIRRNPRFNLRIDQWQSLHKHDEVTSGETAQWADVIFCEWAGPNLAWHSKNKRPGTRLISRLHRFEINGRWMQEVDFSQVDLIVTVSNFIRDEVISRFNLRADQVVVIPNSVDAFDLDRPKYDDAMFNLALIGYVGFWPKRPDRALNLFEMLLKEDERYRLILKGRNPWEYPHEWNAKPIDRQRYLEFYERIARNPILRERVIFEPFSADIAEFLRRIGFVLSPSELESFHLAPAEGMSSRAIPIVWEREGAAGIFSNAYVHDSMASMAEQILSLRDPVSFALAGENARKFALRWDIDEVMPHWNSVFTGD